MHAWVAEAFGDYRRVLRQMEVADPVPGDDGAVIEVKAAGVMFADLLNITGQYQSPVEPPFVPGAEAAGVVIAAGPNSRFKEGDRVTTVMPAGAFAEQVAAPADRSYLIPDDMPFTDAACFCINYQTGYMSLVRRARMQSGDVVLVHAGASGVGVAAIQLARAHGCTVLATASSDTKLEICRQAGAHEVINYADADFVEAVMDYTQGRGADIVYDPVGGETFIQSTRCMALGGRLVVIGFASGSIPEVKVNRLLLRNIDVIGFFLRAYNERDAEELRKVQDTLYELYAEEKIAPILYHEYEFDDLHLALEAIQSRVCYGKAVLVC